ncbi:uncharacterized protein LOC122071472 [Macadamia integrifolia]|uniref:uncharacterized protein LOC122071472 n=1 Tax=Macadamia integrifolia TaxID=60698 RepID=UPI001C4FA921|nr:uncharacterized protein LOC122071472 [Macadamia integrifolia]
MSESQTLTRKKMAQFQKALLILCTLMFSTVIIPPKSLVAARALAETSESNQEKRSTSESYVGLTPTKFCDEKHYGNCLPRRPSVPQSRCSIYNRCRSGGRTPKVPPPPPL